MTGVMASRAVLALVAAALLLTGCGDDEPRAAPSPRISPGAPEIFEHERAGHVPLQLVPGTWMAKGRVLELGTTNEVVVDGEALGTYAAAMEERHFEARVPGCAGEMTWDFFDGDLILSGGGAQCPLAGRWRRE